MKLDIRSAIVGLLFGVIIMSALIEFVAKPFWREQIIQRGYGLCCPNTGDFAFKGECEQ